MTRNPYEHPMDLPPELVEPRRVSALAVSSLIFGILCCIPGFGLIGTILGGSGLIAIGRSEGRLSGRGMAFTGLLLGLFGTLAWLGVLVGGSYTLQQMGTYSDIVRAADKGDHTGVRAMLSPAAAKSITDAQIDAFAARVKAEHGAFQGPPSGLAGWFSGYGAVGEGIQRVTANKNPQPIPLPVRFDQGWGLCLITIDPSATMGSGMATVGELIVIAKDGSEIKLGDPPPEGNGG